jgi:hypothetical protein
MRAAAAQNSGRPHPIRPSGRPLDARRLGEKIPALTVAQMREVFARLLRPDRPTPERIAEEISRVLRRNEEARIYHWYAAERQAPPRRGEPDG